jgi:hypothetical protein
MIKNIKSWFSKPAKEVDKIIPPQKSPPPKKKEPDKTAKQIATEAGEPYVAVLGMDVDLDNLHQGAFELDWNEIFVARLIKAGYQGKVDADIVDQWFQNVCRHVVMETWEQEQAIKNSGIWVQSKDIGNGRSEVS